jgi:hypothetical protein
MADPTNPAGAGGPPSGGGGNPPIDPGVGNVFQKMGDFIGDVNVRLDKTEETLKKITAVIEKQTDEFKKQIKVSEDIEGIQKKIVDWGRKRRDQNIKDFQDGRKAKKELEEIAELYKKGLDHAKAGSKEAKEMNKKLSDVKKTLKDIEGQSTLTDDKLHKMAEHIADAAHNAKDLLNAMSNLSRRSAALKGAAGILGSLGIGKGVNAAINRRLEQAEEVKEKVKEARELRYVATRKHMGKKRSDIIDKMGGAKGLTTDEDFEVLATRMGFGKGHKRRGDIIAGEKAIAAGGEGGEAYTAAMGEGGGKIAEAMGGMEDGLMKFAEIAPEIIIPLEILAGVITLLIAAFDGYVKQNQEIEKGIGKGGLFTQPGVGVGDAFMRARMALNPNILTNENAGNLLMQPQGITYERNLALAQAATEAGYNVADSFKGNAPDTANAPGLGGAGQFMGGNLGEMQRIVMGVSRVAGLTDPEATANLIKLLQEYRETMASSEQFMNQLNRDTQAAGISTGKYLKIIDEVSGHFDRMGKSLEQVTGVMRELSRYGAVSTDSLKDMMDFLASGADKTTLSNISQSIFTNMVTPGALKKANIEGEGAAVQSAVDAVNDQLTRPGIGVSGLNLAGMSTAQAQNAIAQKRQEALGINEPSARQQVTDALDKLSDQILHQTTVQGDAMKMAGGEMLYGADPLQQTRKLFGGLDEVLSRAGVSRESFMRGDVTGTQAIQIQQEADMLGIKDLKKSIPLLMDEAQNRIKTATTDETQTPENRRKFIKQLLLEISRKPGGVKMTLGGHQFDTVTDSLDTIADAAVKNPKEAAAALSENAFTIAGSIDTQQAIMDKMRMEQKVGITSEKDALDTANDIANRTQTVEDILKNVFKPLLVDLVTALEFIAKEVGDFFHDSFAVDKEKVQKDMASIPGAMAELTAKTKDLIKQQDVLAAQAQKEGRDPRQDPQFKELSKQIEENNKTLSYLRDATVVGVKTGADEDVLEQKIDQIHGYIKGGAAVSAPTGTPGMPDLSHSMLGFGIVKGGLTDKGIEATKTAINYYVTLFHGETNQSFVPPATPAASAENAGDIKGVMPAKPVGTP